jgi:hypothetical protein
MSLYQPGTVASPALVGTERVLIDNGGAVVVTCTTDQIAALAASAAGVGIVNTPITTVGNGTLTAAGLVGGLIVRTGPTAAFSDATDTAAAIIAALPSVVVGATFFIRIKNATAWPETITAGTGVTLPSTNIVPPFSYALYYGTVATSSTVSLTHLNTTAIASATVAINPIVTALATNGAGTVLAAAIVGGVLNRTTVAAPFADTTDTAAAIIAASAGMLGRVGESFFFTYTNNSTGVCILGGGSGVTVSGITTIPPGMAANYLVTYTAAATITMVGINSAEISPNNLVIGGATSGQVTVTAPAVAGTAALSLPPNAAGTLASTSGSNLLVEDVYRSTLIQTANTNVTPAPITGLSGAVAIGTYDFEATLYCTVASATAGIAISQLLTTAVLSSCNFTGKGFLAAGIATQGTTTTTSGTALFTAADQPIEINIKGTFIVGTAGTFGLQMCQNTSNASNSSVNVGSTMKLTRIA